MTGIELRAPGGRPYVVGHRGAMGHAPENTLASFRKGFELGAPLLELDVHMSADAQLVVIHDETVDRTTNGSGRVVELSATEIRRLDAGSWFGSAFAGEPVPMLDEILEWRHGRVGLVIELKLGPVWYPGIEEGLVRLLRQHGAEAEVLVISFDHFAARRVKVLAPAVKTAVMYGGRPIDAVAMARAAHADAVYPALPIFCVDACQSSSASHASEAQAVKPVGPSGIKVSPEADFVLSSLVMVV